MIVRIQFVEKEKGNVIHCYSLFCVQGTWTLRTLFHKIKTGEVTCGLGIDLTLYDDNVLASTFSCTKPPSTAELMPTPLEINLESLTCNRLPLYIGFECTLKLDDKITDEADCAAMPCLQIDTITNVLMRKTDHYVALKPESKKNDIKQYNTLVSLSREKRFGVRGSYLDDFESF